MRLIHAAGAGLLLFFCFAGIAPAQEAIARFVGDFTGSADIEAQDGSIVPRDMSVTIRQTGKGFLVRWSSTTYRDGRGKQKTYEISFVPSGREGVYAAAMTRNVFGHEVPLDPMKGEPYVWARIKDDTLTVFSLFVAADGGYELQQFDRTLSGEGLELGFQRIENGESRRRVSTFLRRE